MRTCLRTLAAVSAAFAFLIGLAAPPAYAGDAIAVAPVAASAATAAENPDPSSTLVIFNRPVAQFHASLSGMPPVERVRRAQSEVARVLQSGGPGTVSVTETPQGKIVLIDEVGVFGLLPDDLDGIQTVEDVLRALSQAVQEAKESRSFSMLMRAIGFAALASLFLAAGVWVLRRLRFWLGRTLVTMGHRHSQRLALGGAALLSRDRIFTLARAFTTLVFYLLLFVLIEAWLGVVLRLFPYTRPWGEQLNESTLNVAGKLLAAVAASLPGLAVAIVIFFIARGVIGLTTPFFAQVERGDLNLPWIDKYAVRSTRGLVHIGVWLFALAMAYPYLPGSQTEAFKGISVVLGLMLSLGSSNVIGQAVSGLILTYSRTLHVGEYVRIGDVEGTVTEMTTFATRVRTGLGEELSLPNSMITGTVTKNYSRAVKGEGYIVDTVLTIGYDTPWRLVHEMMIEGARRTEGIMETPAPHVFQTALSDFYVEYRLVAQAIASEPRPRAQVMNDLHANLQDVFNENGVQIMSPHYLGDPAVDKIVAPLDWNPPIAPRRGAGSSS